jgi:hypothetical protein
MRNILLYAAVDGNVATLAQGVTAPTAPKPGGEKKPAEPEPKKPAEPLPF